MILRGVLLICALICSSCSLSHRPSFLYRDAGGCGNFTVYARTANSLEYLGDVNDEDRFRLPKGEVIAGR